MRVGQRINKKRGLILLIINILMAILIFSSCGDNYGRNLERVPEKINLNDQDAILESSTYLGFGYINIVLIRGHEYAIYSSRNDQFEGKAVWGTHLEETCIGCRGGSLRIDTILLESHRYKITQIKYKDGGCSVWGEHITDVCKACNQ